MNDKIIDVTLSESAGASPIKKGKRWLVTIAKPGVGQMGTYPEETLKRFGPAAFPAGTKSYFGHKSRDARDQVGSFKEGAFWNDEEGELQGILTPFPRYADVLDEAKDDIEASMHVASRKDSVSNVVKELVYHRANTVDLVGFGGLEGSGLKFQLESLFAEAAALGEDGEREENMEITKEMWDGLVANQRDFAAKFDTFVSESLKEKQGQADADAVAELVATRVEEALAAYNETAKAIDAADILTVQKEALKEEARKGKDVSSDLASAVSFVSEARKEFKVDPKQVNRGNVVVVQESLDSDNDFNPSMGAWH